MSSVLSGVRAMSSAASNAGAHNFGLWRNVSLFVCIPAVAVIAYTSLIKAPHHEPPEFVPYTHLRIRRKAFPWGDGKETLFHNDHVNALPDGYHKHH